MSHKPHYASNNNELVLKLTLFVILPFASLLYSLIKPVSKSSLVIYFLFGILFCWHMDHVGGTRYDDYLGIVERFNANIYTLSDFWGKAIEYFSFTEESEKDIYEIFLNALTRCFSTNHHLFFALASIPYLLFSIKSIEKMSHEAAFPTGLNSVIILFLFIIPRDILSVQNPRFTTGIWLSIYGMILYFHPTTKSRFYSTILIISTPLFHSGFWPFVIFFLISQILPFKEKLINIIFYISIPFSFFSYEFFTAFNYSFLPANLTPWIEHSLYGGDYEIWVLHEGRSGLFWVQLLFERFKYFTYLTIPFLLIKNRKVVSTNKQKIINYYILLFSFSNFIATLPVIGTRYFTIVQIISIYIWIVVLYPKYDVTWKMIILSWTFYTFNRWFYDGAGVMLVPKNIYYSNLPMLIMEYI